MKSLLTAALFAGSVFTAHAEPAYQNQICIIWDNTGRQMFGEPCVFQEWNNQFRIRDGLNIPDGSKFDMFVDDDGAAVGWRAEGTIEGYNVDVIWYRGKDGMFYWSNGALALSVEEYEGD